MPKVYVVIPHYNNWNLTHARLWELYKYCREDIEEVLVVDDCSTDNATEGGLRWWAEFRTKHNFKIRALQTPENLNFLRASNLGLSDTVSKCQPEDIIILLSNDVEIRANFIPQVTDIVRQPKFMTGGILYYYDTGWNVFGDKIFSYLEGWLLAMRAEDWKALDYFDEQFSPSDYEDIDLSTKAFQAGFLLSAINHPGIRHLGAQTMGYNPERLARTNENKKKFEEKWVTKANET